MDRKFVKPGVPLSDHAFGLAAGISSRPFVRGSRDNRSDLINLPGASSCNKP
jgi:hypothetical protein